MELKKQYWNDRMVNYNVVLAKKLDYFGNQ